MEPPAQPALPSPEQPIAANGLRPLPWPPWTSSLDGARAPAILGGAWLVSFFLCLGLGYLSIKRGWFNFPAGGWHLGLYPPWTLAVWWTLWAGWFYGGALLAITALLLGGLLGPEAFPFILADAVGVAVFYIFLRGFAPDPRMQRLRDLGLLLAGVFFAAIASATGAFFVKAFGTPELQPSLALWEGWWLGHVAEGALVTAPGAALLGGLVERWKERGWATRSPSESMGRQLAAVTVAGVGLIFFYTVWTLAVGAEISEAIGRWAEDADSEGRLLHAYRSSRLHLNVLMATLLGLAAFLAALVVLLRRHFQEELREERERSMEALRERQLRANELGNALWISEVRLEEILDGIPALVVGIGREGRIESFNFTAESVLGWRRNEVQGRDFFDLFVENPDERGRMRRRFGDVMLQGGRSQGVLVTIQDRSGKPHKVRWSSEPLRGSDGALRGVMAMGMDVTEQLQMEAQFLQAQKMESVGALAGGLAHDFNNLLGGILGQSVLARAQVSHGDPLQQVLTKIESAAQRGADLTGKLLAFSRKSIIQPVRLDLGALLRETTGLLSGTLPRDISVQLEVEPGLPPVLGDATQIQQVLINLCVNARDAMPQGGTLSLAARAESEGGVRVDVRDTGAGISESVRAHLFEPFFTTKEPGKGTGLGLAVAFGIMQNHEARIEVESQPGRGTCFTLRFPPLPSSLPAEAQLGSQRMPLQDFPMYRTNRGGLKGNEEVLLVDDEIIMRETYQQLLQGLGYHVVTASGGQEALDLIDSKSAKPEVVVLDVMMPGLSKTPLLQQLKSRLPNIPVVLITGYSQDATVQGMLAEGASDLVMKPFRVEDLAEAIRRVLYTRSGQG